VGLFGRKKSAPKPPEDFSLKTKFALWWAGRWYRDALAGKHGEENMQFIQKLAGLRTAIMAIILLAEVVAKQFGFDAGPFFSLVRGLFAALNWDTNEAAGFFGVEPAALLASALTLWAAILRVKAYFAAKPAVAPTESAK
jgi:hypothetical protein